MAKVVHMNRYCYISSTMRNARIEHVHELDEESVEGKEDQQPQFHRDPLLLSLFSGASTHPATGRRPARKPENRRVFRLYYMQTEISGK